MKSIDRFKTNIRVISTGQSRERLCLVRNAAVCNKTFQYDMYASNVAFAVLRCCDLLLVKACLEVQASKARAARARSPVVITLTSVGVCLNVVPRLPRKRTPNAGR